MVFPNPNHVSAEYRPCAKMILALLVCMIVVIVGIRSWTIYSTGARTIREVGEIPNIPNITLLSMYGFDFLKAEVSSAIPDCYAISNRTKGMECLMDHSGQFKGARLTPIMMQGIGGRSKRLQIDASMIPYPDPVDVLKHGHPAYEIVLAIPNRQSSALVMFTGGRHNVATSAKFLYMRGEDADSGRLVRLVYEARKKTIKRIWTKDTFTLALKGHWEESTYKVTASGSPFKYKEFHITNETCNNTVPWGSCSCINTKGLSPSCGATSFSNKTGMSTVDSLVGFKLRIEFPSRYEDIFLTKGIVISYVNLGASLGGYLTLLGSLFGMCYWRKNADSTFSQEYDALAPATEMLLKSSPEEDYSGNEWSDTEAPSSPRHESS